MAETVISLVLGKLSDAVIKQTLFLYGVHDKVERVQRDLAWIRSFLKDADAKRHKNERVKQWVKEVKEVGFWIEDALDVFLNQVEEASRRKMRRIPMKLIAKHKLGTEIDKIHQRIREISESTATYGIRSLEDNDSIEAHSSNLPARPLMIPDIDETEVVGFAVDKKRIIEQLTDPNITRRSVISIVGAGGSGKTTLAKEVYKSVKAISHFAIHLWVTVSEDYKFVDILLKILEGITQIDSNMREKGEEYLISKIYKLLKEKRYLVVLDDVWSSNLWIQLQVALCNSSNNGSRLLITTRFINVSVEMDATSKPYEITALNDKESRQLLLKKVFPNQYANECPEDMLDLASQFAKTCRGLPLALVVLGGILSTKRPNYHMWSEVMRNMDWQTDGSKCMDIISTSYTHLSFHLKPCFMYLAVFPEDYQIKTNTLIRLWISEGFILCDQSKIMEDIAENYLEELVQRCMVQVSSRYANGKIKYCHVHDLLRELAIQKAKEDNFLTVFTRNDNCSSGGSAARERRVALNFCDHMALEHVDTNLRSLNSFGDQILSSNRFGMLRVLNIQSNVDGISKLFDAKRLRNLTALKYLQVGINDDGICMCFLGHPPFNIGLTSPARMENLQTIHIKDVCGVIVDLPSSLWDNKLLRHVIFVLCKSNPTQIMGPPSSADLPNLLTLKGVIARQEWSTRMPHFPRLRKLKVSLPWGVDESIWNSLSNLQNLGSLWVERPIECATSALGSHRSLYSLHIENCTKATTEFFNMLPQSLLKLDLTCDSIEEDPMPMLGSLPNLTVLSLYLEMPETNGNQLICSKGGFARLQRLELEVPNVEEWKIEEGAMPILTQLQLSCCTDLRTVPNLQYLTNLQELTVQWRSRIDNPAILRIKGEDHWRVAHVPVVQFHCY